jgi:hypothetical protein
MSTINVDVITSQTPSAPVTIQDNLIVTGTNNIRPYKVYSALLSQTGTNAPTAIELENTIGFIGFNYQTTGIYSIISNGDFISNKTAIFANNVMYANGETVACAYGGPTFCQISTRLSGTTANNILALTFVEIRVYP